VGAKRVFRHLSRSIAYTRKSLKNQIRATHSFGLGPQLHGTYKGLLAFYPGTSFWQDLTWQGTFAALLWVAVRLATQRGSTLAALVKRQGARIGSCDSVNVRLYNPNYSCFFG
jgi:hypothetical protein